MWRGDSWRGSCYLQEVASEGGADKVTLELRTEESVEEASHGAMRGKPSPTGDQLRCKGPQVESKFSLGSGLQILIHTVSRSFIFFLLQVTHCQLCFLGSIFW